MVEPRRLLALTLHRPWPDAIFRWPGKHAKLIENRTWWRRSLLGRHFAIHAGSHYDRAAAEWLGDLAEGACESNDGWRVPSPADSPLGIVGVARLCGVIDADERGEPVLIAGRYPGFVWREWWMGGIGWLLEDVTPIEPVACRGAQGLWTVPPEVADVVRGRWKEARRAA